MTQDWVKEPEEKNEFKCISAGWYLQKTVVLNGNQTGMRRWAALLFVAFHCKK
jgi:hypothetical protein